MKKDHKRKLSLGDIIRKMNENAGDPNANSGKSKPLSEKPDTPNSLSSFQEENGEQKKIPPSQSSQIPEDISVASSQKKVASSTIPQNSLGTHNLNERNQLSNPSTNPYEHSSAHSTSSPLPPRINQAGENEEEEEQFDIFRYLGILLRRKEIIILATILGGAFSLYVFLKSEKNFFATARLLFKPNQESIINTDHRFGYYMDRNKNFNTHLELMKSNIVLERVIEGIDEIISIGVIKSQLNIKPGEINGEETNIIELRFKHPNAEIARNVVNNLCKTYIDYRREVNAQEDTRLIIKLKVQIDKIQNDLQTKETILRKFKEDNQMVHLSNETHLITKKLADMEVSLQQTQLNLLESKERLITLKSQISQQEINVVQSMTYENPMRSKLAELELELNTLSGEYSSDHYKIKQINQKIENLKTAMGGEITKQVSQKAVKETLIKNPIRESLLQAFVNQNIEISALEAKRIAQEQIIKKLNNEMAKMPSLEQDFSYLQRETESLLKTLKMLKIKFEETKIRRDSKESELKILELAQTPRIAISTKKKSSIFIGLIIGCIVGIAFVFLLEYLDQSLKDPSEVEKNLELPLIGIVPLIETENAVVNNQNLKKSMLEPFRTLRANLKHIATQHRAKMFMVCSAIKGEGKTTLATNLAITFAMDERKTILMDCDLRRSHIHTLINIPKTTGLAEYIRDENTLDEIIKPTIHENLFVITSGERPPNPSELLGMAKFNHLLMELKSRADIVICDSPAIIPVSDSLTMAPYMDCCIMVTRILWTPLKAAKQARNQLIRIKSNLIGCILNGISHSRGYYPYYYGYYGYYSYKYAYDYDEEPKKKNIIREAGLTFDAMIKSIIQNTTFIFPRLIVRGGGYLKAISSNYLFWFLFIILVGLISTRYLFFPQTPKASDDLILYLGHEQQTKKSNNSNKQSKFLLEDHRRPVFSQNTNNLATEETKDKQGDISNSHDSGNSFFALQDSLNIWKASYNSSNTSRFLQFYDIFAFKYPGGEYDQWKHQITSSLLQKSNRDFIISIDSITNKSIKNKYYETTMLATIAHGKDTSIVKKTMIWQQNHQKWRIIREKKQILQ